VTTTAIPDVSVSIVLFDSSACLPDLIAALRAQTGVPFETFVIDNASRDADVARRQLADAQLGDVTWNAENVGYGRAHNQNLARFRGRYVVLLNPDVRFGPDLLDHLVRFMDAHLDVAIAGPRVLEGVTRREFQPRRFYRAKAWCRSSGSRPLEIGWLNGCCLIVRRSVCRRSAASIGLPYAEETDLCSRARRRAIASDGVRNAEAHHLHLQSQLRSDADERSRRPFAASPRSGQSTTGRRTCGGWHGSSCGRAGCCWSVDPCSPRWGADGPCSRPNACARGGTSVVS
jgi:GT2 family glycosyltransferase